MGGQGIDVEINQDIEDFFHNKQWAISKFTYPKSERFRVAEIEKDLDYTSEVRKTSGSVNRERLK